jgi:hypothetical protein
MAYQEDPNYRGIRKALGYSYAWNGSTERAISLLEMVPEAETELFNYPLFWRNQGRGDLAQNAEALLARLDSASSP